MAQVTSTFQSQVKPVILIVDKKNRFGKALASLYEADYTVVLVSSIAPDSSSSVVGIFYGSTIPTIPDGLYKKIIFVWEEETKNLFEPLVEKAKDSNAGFICLVSYRDFSLAKTFDEHLFRTNCIGIFGDVFNTPTQKEFLDEWIIQVKKTKKIHLVEMGLGIWYPVEYADVISSIDTLLQNSQKGKFLLSPHHPYTQLALSHFLQKTDPFITIDFREGSVEEGKLPEGDFVFSSTYPLVEKVQAFYNGLVVRGESFTQKEKTILLGKKEKKQRSAGSSFLLFLLYACLVFIAMPFVATFLLGGIATWSLQQSVVLAQQGKLQEAVRNIDFAQQEYATALFGGGLLNWELSFVGQGTLGESIVQKIQTGQSLSGIAHNSFTSVSLLQSVLQGKSLRPQEDVSEATALLKATAIDMRTTSLEGIPNSYTQKLDSFKKALSLVEEVGDVIPSLVGAAGDKKYLVLFQNNMELRPGGGFIGSYGILDLRKGKLDSFSLHDVYDADGQLKGHIEPPFALRRYMPIVHLYMRDSNFDVDFEKSAQQVAYMYTQETGQPVDGVVGLDLSFVKDIITAIGPIFVPSYNETVTGDNFFLVTEKHAEKNFFAGSTQKKDFLSALYSAMQTKISQKGVISEKLLQEGLQALYEKHVLFAFSDPQTQTPFAVNNFSSTLVDTRDTSPQAFLDFLGINEANLGVNKVNYAITRSLVGSATIDPSGTISETTILTFTNNSNGSWPGGVYKNYLRFILPDGVTLSNIKINNQTQSIIPAVTDFRIYEAKSFHVPVGLEVEKNQEAGKSIFGFLVNIMPKKQMSIQVTYTFPNKMDMSQALTKYSLKVFKQPGVDDIPYTFTLSYPKNLIFLKSSVSVTKSPGKIVWNQDITKDTIATFSFAKQ